jgi:low affinity Fe/Cu permease
MPEDRDGVASREHTIFAVFARWTERQMGRPAAFLVAVLVVIVWAVSGPLFAWSDTWQLVINTGTTIVTFLMVFVIQHTQTRDTQALQLKLDELIRVNETARNSLISLEERPDSEVDDVKSGFAELTAKNDAPANAAAPALGMTS